jgi:hypothetical protein
MTEQDEFEASILAAAAADGFPAVRVDCVVTVDELPDTVAALVLDRTDRPRLVFVSSDALGEDEMAAALERQAFGRGPRALEAAALLWRRRKAERDHESAMRIYADMRPLGADA